MRSYTLFVLSIMCLFSSFVFAANGDMGGLTQDGSPDFPYLIEDFNDFQTFCADPNYWASGIYTRLDCNLNLDPNLADRIIYSQSPIAGETHSAYAGNFVGNGHVISNLTVNGENFCALFGKTDEGSSITGLGLENTSISGTSTVATMVGMNYGSITSSYSTGAVISSGDCAGGLVGENGTGGNIISSYSIGAVTGDNCVGGLVGYSYGNITSSYSTGTVNGNDYVGGLMGYNSSSGSVTTSYSAVVVTGSGDFVGSLVGYSNSDSITNSFWDVETCGLDVAYTIYRSFPDHAYIPVYSTAGIAEGKTTLEMQTLSTFTNAGWDFVGETPNGTHQTWQMPPGGGYPVLSILNGYVPIVLSGDGSKENPYLIGDANDLGAMIYCDTNAYYKLIADINLAEIRWQRTIILDLAGHFDGDGYIISNMNIRGSSYLGLFGRLYDGAEVANVGLENVIVTGTGDNVAALVGYNDSGNISNSFAAGTVTGDDYVGGLVGCNIKGNIISSYSTGAVTSLGDYVGGLVGWNDGIIISSYSTGAVTGYRDVGGLVGWNSFGNITNSYSTGNVNGDSEVGGLVGWNWGNISSSYSTGEVNGNYEVGGLVGINDSGSGSIASSFWNVETCGLDIAYTQKSGNYPYYVYTPVSSTIGIAEGKTTTQMQTQSTFTDAGWDFVSEIADGTSQIWQMPVGGGYPVLSVFNGYVPIVLCGNGSKENPYLIGDANDLGAVIYYDNRACYKLIADIDLAGIQWGGAIILDFAGHFDGDGYIISNMNIDGGSYLGLFGRLYSGAEVANIGLESVMVTSTGYYVAGLVGSNRSGSITSSYSTGSVTGLGNCVGGLVGRNSSGSITSSYSTGEVTGNGYVGGLVGTNYYGSVTSSYSIGEVTGDDDVGGLVGSNRSGSITSSYSTGSVTGLGNSVGGLVGRNSSGSITSSYSTGEVTGNGYVGGLVGINYYDSINITNCFWDVNTSSMDITYTQRSGSYPYVYTPIYSTVGVAEGKTTLEMKTEITFTDACWDFVGESDNGDEDIWRMCVNGVEYLKFWWEFAAADFACGDGVDIIDFAVLAQTWGLIANDAGYNDRCDLDDDDVIDFDDLAIFCDNWLEGM